jgi:hypothetical protein
MTIIHLHFETIIFSTFYTHTSSPSASLQLW